ncbi:MAG: aminopeptidase [Treponema sp.]|jgi:predicted aminopeptidase|nr:aminopeptidase [Treponema sp.]
MMMKVHTALALGPALASALIILLGLGFFSGCYTLKQGTAMLGYLGKAVPLEELEKREETAGASPAEAEETRRFVERVRDIRRFAREELGLAESKNYTRYVQLDRDYLAAVVSACAADSFTRREWRFPVVGTVPYKGFFDPAGARKEAARLKAQGLDVWVRGVDAFSTLGWFRDPLYSYMKDYTAYQLADLIIHELLHATVFVPGQADFNEQLAEFTGRRGGRLYIESRYGIDSPECRAVDSAEADGRTFRLFLSDLGSELESLYAKAGLDREAKLAEKERIIQAARKRFAEEYDRRFQSGGYRFFADLPVNNAYLDLFRLYHEEDNFLDELFETVADPGPPVPSGPGDPAKRAAPSGETVASGETAAGIRRLRAFAAAAAKLDAGEFRRAARRDPRQALQAALRQAAADGGGS